MRTIWAETDDVIAPAQPRETAPPGAKEERYARFRLHHPDQTISPAFKDSLKKDWDTAAADF
jgi:hypothetical protein